jgi:antibiotic biosynthesis monooxygenase (ABM) superfamily enzyme
MDIAGLLFNAASGGIVGSAIHLVTDWVDTRNKIALLKAQTESAEKTEAWKAFTAAQQSNAPFTVPANTPAWASALYTLVAALKDSTRPLLTWAAVFVIFTAFNKAVGPAQDELAKELVFGGFTAIFFWFGSRYTRK